MNASKIANDIMRIFQKSMRMPYDTGNLANNGVVSRGIGNGNYRVIIGGDVAPYAVYLEYCPLVGRSDKINRHKGFVEKIVAQEVIPYLKGLRK